jgi:4-hydroxyphenylacetate decarboxylase small subunit
MRRCRDKCPRVEGFIEYSMKPAVLNQAMTALNGAKEVNQMTQLAYKDTRNYAPLDATKGIDVATGAEVMADDPAPGDYNAMPKCRNCVNYEPTDDKLGICKVDVLQTERDQRRYTEERFFAYAEMDGLTCENHEFRK